MASSIIIPQVPDYRTITKEERECFAEILKSTAVPCINLEISRGETDIFNSKLGGTPYLPQDMEYPLSSRGKPLRLLCQLNFGQLPHIPGFPEKGILQFYASDEDGLIGMNPENLTNQENWRTIYHENVIFDESKLKNPPTPIDSEGIFPF